jgi:hypothetical protein
MNTVAESTIRSSPLPRHGKGALRAVLLLCAALLAVLSVPRATSGQTPGVKLFEPKPASMVTRCEGGGIWQDPVVEAVREVLALSDKEEARARLLAWQDTLGRVAKTRPDDPQAQFRLAVALGARAEVEGGATRVRVAKQLGSQVDVVLALNPAHPGALHLRGRLHAAVLRLDGVKRFVATRIMGAGELGAASWEEARANLEAAEAADPCMSEHHYELARLYDELGDAAGAAREIGHVLALPPRGAYDRSVLAKAQRLLPAERVARADPSN